jgi:CHAD domain-containing protein
MRRAASESFGPTVIEPGDTIGQVALATLRRQFAILLAKEPGTRLGDDIEELHDMRVASRRLRAALALFNDFLPAEAVRLKPELAWLGRTIGAVRDLDVQLVRLDEWVAAVPPQDREPLTHLHALLAEERARARAEMLQALDSARYERFVRRFGSMLRTRTGGRTPAGLAAAPDLVERRHRAVRKAMKRIDQNAEPAAYHRVRIAAKRFRYALEFLAELYPGETKPVVRRTVELQDLLGEYQDADVGIARLRELSRDRGAELGPETVFVMGEIAERYRSSMHAIRDQVPSTQSGLTGKAWKQLLKHLEGARPPGDESRRSSRSGDASPA